VELIGSAPEGELKAKKESDQPVMAADGKTGTDKKTPKARLFELSQQESWPEPRFEVRPLMPP
jgi:hypothetical protein